VKQRTIHSITDFPAPGTVLLFPLVDGRFGACRVLRVAIPEHNDSPQALVALTEWVGSRPPPLDHASLRKILHLTHHSWSDQPEIIWVGEPPPRDFRVLGVIPLRKNESCKESNSYSGWGSLPLQRLLQWRWEHDRESLLAEEALEKVKEDKKRNESAARRAAVLAAATLPKILKRSSLFPTWEDYPPPNVKRAIEQTIRSFIAALIETKRPSRRDVIRELRRCATALNKLDTKQGHPIETIEREDIFDLFQEILTAAKHADLLEKLDEWRWW
jgi:hypothetical protein